MPNALCHEEKNILYIGRFQPFHNGHKDAIEQIIHTVPSQSVLYIGIGSAEENFTKENPLTAGERFEMIQATLNALHLPFPFFIVPIRNIDHYALWPFHVQQYLPPIHFFFSGSPLVRQLWSHSFPQSNIYALKKNNTVCASDVRNNPNKINTVCPDPVQRLWKKWDIPQRLANMRTG